MRFKYLIYLLVVVLTAHFGKCNSNRLNDLKTVDDYLNICMAGKNQKSKPSEEQNLIGKCAGWKNMSCCTTDTAEELQKPETNWYNFTYAHCADDKSISVNCRSRFIRQLCFYECSPNVGPWLIEKKRKIANEAFLNVPLCQSDCNEWWEDCKDDMTCKDDWSKDWDWSTGTNKCPVEKSCKSFENIFGNSKSFCEKVWGNSFKVVDNNQPCMELWFEGTNPNRQVAKTKAENIIAGSTTLATNIAVLLIGVLGNFL